MEKRELISLAIIPVIVLIGWLISLAGSHNGQTINTIPLFTLGVLIAFVVNWIVFIPAYLKRTEKFFDLTGGITYLSVIWVTGFLAGFNLRSLILMILISIWALRLSIFLYRRIHKAGKDSRFDEIKQSFARFLMTWTIQGLWVSFTLAAALAVITSSTTVEIGIFFVLGLIVWILGFAIEVISDSQKSTFKANPENKGKFISSGLWAWSRHPNYFGEIVLWLGIAIIAIPVLQGWQWITMISPIFVIFLLTKVSGVPMLEKSADERWGGQEDYEAYKRNTPVLILRPPRS
ncbi:MAG: DUF1295 domain-containing protein [Candidatus Heimdallarchaeota archaeon]|nr:DUF1295 domain-containing protein [Candidatus Heimdallarchaeota archaeon]